MYLFDTNIFLEILLGQEKADICHKALEVLSEEKPGWISSFSLHAIEAILGSSGKRERAEILPIFLESLREHPYLSWYATTIEEELEVARLAPQVKLDFDDTLQYYVAKKKKLSLVTLDGDFKKVKDIAIISPKEMGF